MAEDLDFFVMTEEQMKRFAEENPARVDDLDKDGWTVLFAAARKDYTDLVAWLVDEKGASVSCTTRSGLTPLHAAKSPETASFLLARGADVTALDRDGWTPLMKLAYFARPLSCIERLLKESRVIETLDIQSSGSTALHLACVSVYGTSAERAKIIEMLLCAGANPTILDVGRDTPLDILRHIRLNSHTAIALVERALLEPERIFLLAKTREINDANHTIAKAKEDAQRKIIASAPTCLQERVREQQQQQQNLLLGPPLPRVELHRPSAGGGEGEETAKKRNATLQYVLRAPELGEMGGMSADVFVELMEMMTPRWDPIRHVGGSGEDSGSGGRGGGGAGGQG